MSYTFPGSAPVPCCFATGRVFLHGLVESSAARGYCLVRNTHNTLLRNEFLVHNFVYCIKRLFAMTSVRVVWALALLTITGAWVAGSYDLATGSAAAQSTSSGATQSPAPGDNMARLAERLNERGAVSPAAPPAANPNLDRARGLATAASQEADRVLNPQGARLPGIDRALAFEWRRRRRATM